MGSGKLTDPIFQLSIFSAKDKFHVLLFIFIKGQPLHLRLTFTIYSLLSILSSYRKWFTSTCQEVGPGSVIVIDNAPYHTVQVGFNIYCVFTIIFEIIFVFFMKTSYFPFIQEEGARLPTKTSNKDTLSAWLTANGESLLHQNQNQTILTLKNLNLMYLLIAG